MIKIRKGTRGDEIVKVIKQGKQEFLRLTPGGLITPKNLTGYSATLYLKKSIDDITIIDTLTNLNGRITLGASAPTVVCSWNTAKTLTFTSDLVGDLEIKNPAGECEHSYRIYLTLEKRIA